MVEPLVSTSLTGPPTMPAGISSNKALLALILISSQSMSLRWSWLARLGELVVGLISFRVMYQY
jgi:hypothetical protein